MTALMAVGANKNLASTAESFKVNGISVPGTEPEKVGQNSWWRRITNIVFLTSHSTKVGGAG